MKSTLRNVDSNRCINEKRQGSVPKQTLFFNNARFNYRQQKRNVRCIPHRKIDDASVASHTCVAVEDLPEEFRLLGRHQPR